MANSSSSPSFATPPPPTSFSRISFPAPYVLLVTFSRPKALNCMNTAAHYELDALWHWFDYEPSLRVAVCTGEGRAFSAGADLKEWNDRQSGKGSNNNNNNNNNRRRMNASGFGGLSTRSGRKPVIAAVNGICFGGGCEIAVNCDMVLACASATFALPEVKRGVVAVAGALPRLVRTVGKQRAMEMALTGRTLSATEAERWGLVNKVVEDGQVVKAAVAMAQEVAANSPDSIIVSREGIKLGWEALGAQDATEKLQRDWYEKLESGENIKEGLRAFVEKRKPNWVDSKL